MSEQEFNNEIDRDISLPSKGSASPMRQILLGFVILLCGIVIGAGGTLVFGKHLIFELIKRGGGPEFMLAKLERQLDLTPEQVTQIDAILKNRYDEMDKIREEGRPRFEEQIDLLKKDMASVLDENQMKKWLEKEQKMHGLLRPFRPPPREGGPGDRDKDGM